MTRHDKDRDYGEAKTKFSRGEEVKKDASDNVISVESLFMMSVREVSTLTGVRGSPVLEGG